MLLRTPSNKNRRVRNRRKIKEYTYLGCPMTNNRSPWCFRMCRPGADGTGLCGRVAPHGFKSRIQQGIEDFNNKRSVSATLLRHQKPSDDWEA